MSTPPYDLIVIGAGPAGLTAGLYAHRAGLNVLMLGGGTPGGQPLMHYKVENYPGFPGGVTGAELMTRWLKQVMDETGAMPLPEFVLQVEFSGSVKRVQTAAAWYEAPSVIIATGSRPRRLSIPGEEEFAGRGVCYCAMCDAPLLRTMARRRAVVVGGEDTALHTALGLLPHAEKVTVMTRGTELRAKAVLVNRFLRDPKAGVLLGRWVKEITGSDRVTGLSFEETGQGRSETLPVEAVFVGVGQSPVTGFLGASVEMDQEGFIITDQGLRTSVSGVFAAGDVRVTPLRQIVTAAADGALAAQGAADYLRIEVDA